MASFDNHINQARSNLEFLKNISANASESLDWQITVCFYVAVHLINSFVAKEANLHFNTHEQIKNAINPESRFRATRLDDETYLAYQRLFNISRRSRYLCHENLIGDGSRTFFCEEKHLKKALKELNTVIDFIENKYGVGFNSTLIRANLTNPPNLKYFVFETIAQVVEIKNSSGSN